MYNTFEATTIKNSSGTNVVKCRMVTDLKPYADIFNVKVGETYLFTYINKTAGNPATIERKYGTISSIVETLKAGWPDNFFAMVVGDSSDGIQKYEINTTDDVSFNLGTAAESISGKYNKTTDMTINKDTYISKMGSAYSTLSLTSYSGKSTSIVDIASVLSAADKAYIIKYLSNDNESLGSISYTYKNDTAAIKKLTRYTNNTITVTPATFITKAGEGTHTIETKINGVSYGIDASAGLSVTLTPNEATSLFLGSRVGLSSVTTITYNGTDWKYMGQTITLSDLGITITEGTPAENNYIKLSRDYKVSYYVDDSEVNATEYGISSTTYVLPNDKIDVEVETVSGFLDANNKYAGFNSGLTGTYSANDEFTATVTNTFIWKDSKLATYTLADYGINIPAGTTVKANDTIDVKYIPAISTITSVSYTHLLSVPELQE